MSAIHECNACGSRTFKSYHSVLVNYEINDNGRVFQVSVDEPDFSGEQMECTECSQCFNPDDFEYESVSFYNTVRLDNDTLKRRVEILEQE